MHHMWNGAAHRAKADRESITYVYPKEGLDVWGDHFVIPKGAPNVENAKTFINWMMDPKNAAEASNYTGYMNAIAGSGEYLDESPKADPAVNIGIRGPAASPAGLLQDRARAARQGVDPAQEIRPGGAA